MTSDEKMDIILQKLAKLELSAQKMDIHIDFITSVWNHMRTPLLWVNQLCIT